MQTAAPRTPYPAPPLFYKLYAPSDDGVRRLAPPRPPPTRSYQMFGQTFSVDALVPDIAAQEGVVDIFGPDSSLSTAEKLAKLNRDLFMSFIVLVDKLKTDPQQAQAKAVEIRDIAFNMHFLINALRPSQALRAVLCMLVEQVEKKRELTSAGVSALQATVAALSAAATEVLESAAQLRAREASLAEEGSNLLSSSSKRSKPES